MSPSASFPALEIAQEIPRRRRRVPAGSRVQTWLESKLALTSSTGTAHTKTAWNTLVANVGSRDVTVATFRVGNVDLSGSDARCFLDFGIAPSVEQTPIVVLPNVNVGMASQTTVNFERVMRFPLHIPAGWALMVRAQSLIIVTDNTYDIACMLESGGDYPGLWYDTIGATESTTTGAIITGANAAWATTVAIGTPPTLRPYRWLGVTVGGGNDVTQSTADFRGFVAAGPPVAVKAGFTDSDLTGGVLADWLDNGYVKQHFFLHSQNTEEIRNVGCPMGDWLEEPLPAGSGFAGTIRVSGATQAYDLCVHGGYVP